MKLDFGVTKRILFRSLQPSRELAARHHHSPWVFMRETFVGMAFQGNQKSHHLGGCLISTCTHTHAVRESLSGWAPATFQSEYVTGGLRNTGDCATHVHPANFARSPIDHRPPKDIPEMKTHGIPTAPVQAPASPEAARRPSAGRTSRAGLSIQSVVLVASMCPFKASVLTSRRHPFSLGTRFRG